MEHFGGKKLKRQRARWYKARLEELGGAREQDLLSHTKNISFM